MKVLRESPRRDWYVDKECPGCAALLRIEPQDVVAYPDGPCGQGVAYKTVCVCCNRLIHLYDVAIPEFVTRAVSREKR